MLKRIIGENIELVFLPGRDLGLVKADPNQIGQVIINLAVNAKDAMPDGGRLTIETSNVDLDGDYASAHPGCVAGENVMICVSDTGCGMNDEVKSHLFEPFFTTKEQGKGSGLGLATVYGIVRQSRGHIYVYSEPGHGTALKIYLPRTVGEASAAGAESLSAEALRGSETILLVEDDEMVRKLVERILEGRGYKVLAAAGPTEALKICGQRGQKIDLILTDVIMPGMNGDILAARAAEIRPEAKIIFMSGYTERFAIDPGVLSGAPFLQKPLVAEAVLKKIREVLGGKP